MKDQKTLERIQLLHPIIREEVKKIYDEICEALTGNAICRFAYTLRTFAEQDALYAQGRTKPGSKVTNAKGGQSYHNYGLAIDIVLLTDNDKNNTFESATWNMELDSDGDRLSDWQEIVAIFKRHGWEWGGEWKFADAPHFQKTFGMSITTLQKMHDSEKFLPNSNYLNFFGMIK